LLWNTVRFKPGKSAYQKLYLMEGNKRNQRPTT
jgi:hypothetical protein